MKVIDFPSIPTPSEADLNATRSGCTCASDFIVRLCEPKIAALARSYARAGCDPDQLVQAGRIAVWKAAKVYESRHGVPFENYATRAIINGFLDELSSNPVILQLSEVNCSSLDANNKYTSNYEQQIGSDMDNDLVSNHAFVFKLYEALSMLSELAYDVLYLLYACGYSQRHAASLLAISQPRISQIHRGALGFLRSQIESNTTLN